MEALLCIENSLSVHTLYFIYYNRLALYLLEFFSFSSSQSNISKIGLCPHYLNPLNTSINPFRVGSGWFPELQLIFCLSHTDVQSCQKLGCIAIILCDVVIMYKLACLQHTSTLLAFRVNKDHDSGEPKLPLADTQEQEHTVDFYQRLFKHRHQYNCNMFRTYKRLWTRSESNDV